MMWVPPALPIWVEPWTRLTETVSACQSMTWLAVRTCRGPISAPEPFPAPENQEGLQFLPGEDQLGRFADLEAVRLEPDVVLPRGHRRHQVRCRLFLRHRGLHGDDRRLGQFDRLEAVGVRGVVLRDVEG
jgi:hypothetical protein